MRYILIDNCSGYIFGDTADMPRVPISTSEGFPMTQSELSGSDGPILAARWLDEAVIGEHGRAYATVHSLASNETGYLVYRADGNGSDTVCIVQDGQDADTIEAVRRDCDLVATVRCTSGG